MPVIGRLKEDGLQIAGTLDERSPAITNGLIVHYPFDGSLIKARNNVKGIKVLACFYNTTNRAVYQWLAANGAIITDHTNYFADVTVDVAKTYDLILADYFSWSVNPIVIDRLKAFVDAGVSCISIGNDSRTNYFVKTYSSLTTQAAHDIIIDEFSFIGEPMKIYSNISSADLMGGIAELQNGATPYYRRSDTGDITGYIYESMESGAVLYHDQEGSGLVSNNELIINGILYALNRSNGRTINTNTTLTDRGISIEYCTTNLELSKTDTMGGSDKRPFNNTPHSTFEKMSDISNAPQPPIEGLTVWKIRNSSPNYINRFGVQTRLVTDLGGYDKTYTASIWVYIPKEAAINPNEVLGWAVQNSTGVDWHQSRGYNSQYNYYSAGNIHSSQIYLDVKLRDQWQKLSITFKPLSTNVKLPENSGLDDNKYIAVMFKVSLIGTDNTSFIYASGLQIEEKDFATECNIGNRSTQYHGIFEMPVNIDPKTQPFTFHMEFAPNGRNGSDQSNKIQFGTFGYLWHYFAVGGDAANRRYIWDFNTTGTRIAKDLIDPTPFTPYKFETLSFTWDLTTIDFFRNGKNMGMQRAKTVDCILGVIDKIRFEYPQMTIRNVSIYDRVLNATELLKLSNNKFSIDKDGNIIGVQISENQLVLPDNMYYVPLAVDTNEVHNRFSAISSENIIFENSAAFTGYDIANIAADNVDMWSNTGNHIDITDKIARLEPSYKAYGIQRATAGSGPIIIGRTTVLPSTVYSGHVYAWIDTADDDSGALYLREYKTSNPGGDVKVYLKYNGLQLSNGKLPQRRWIKLTFDNITTTSDASALSFCTYVNALLGRVFLTNPCITLKHLIDIPGVNQGTSIPGSKLLFNLNGSIGFDWNADWTICYWKKPISTASSNLVGYNIDSLGCNNPNTVGGGYLWWGKDNNKNEISGSTPNIINPSKYFGNWRMVSLQRTNNKIIIKEWSPLEGVYIREYSVATIATNFYLTQYGFDLQLGGWDQSAYSNAWYKDLIITKGRCLSDTELDKLFRTQLSNSQNNINIQHILSESIQLL